MTLLCPPSTATSPKALPSPNRGMTRLRCRRDIQVARRVVSEIAPSARLLLRHRILNLAWIRGQFDRHQSDSSAVLHRCIEWNGRAATARDDHAGRQKSIDHEEEDQRTCEQHVGLDYDDCHEHRGSGVVADAGCGAIRKMQ
jgi:hypothetical protein